MTGQQAYEQFSAMHNLPVLLQSWYLDISCQDGSWELAFVEQEGLILCILPYFRKKRWFLQYITVPSLSKYMGPVFADHVRENEKEDLLVKMLMQLPKVDFSRQQWLSRTLLELEGYLMRTDHVLRDTYIWNIAQKDADLLQSMDGNYRRSINKFGDDLKLVNTKIKQQKSRIEAFMDLQELSMGTFESHGLTRKQVQNLIQALERRKVGKLLCLYKDDQLVSSSLIAWDKERAYYIFTANDKRFNKIYPGVQMAWKTRSFLLENTPAGKLDFLGSSITSIAKVWLKLGAEKTYYPMLEGTASRRFILLNKLKNLLRTRKNK